MSQKRSNSKTKTNSNSRVESIKVTIEKKKECNSKALEIVENLSENTVDEKSLVEILNFIDQEHYQDIVEERSINKMCGYSLCSKKLKNIPAQQYHICTIHNKVFDITDRKNFCSNLCYKASKYLKDQILTSPVWLRECTAATKYSFLSLQSKGGFAGEEVDLGVSSIKQDVDALLLKDKSNSSGVSEESVVTTLPEDKAKNSVMASPTSKDSDLNKLKDKDVLQDSVEVCSSDLQSERLCADNEQSFEPQDSKLSLNETCNEPNTCIALDNKVDTGSFLQGSNNSKEINLEVNVDLKYADKEFCDKKCEELDKESNSADASEPHSPLNHSENFSGNPSINVTNNQPRKQSTTEAKANYKSKLKKKSKNAVASPLQTVVIKIEQTLKEWFTLESLCFTFGEEKVKEMLAEKSNLKGELANLTGGSLMDSCFYERYLAICKKLNVLELEDSKIDSSFREDEKRPLPDYEALKKESEELELKVKMFYKGDKVVQFDNATTEHSESKENNLSQEPVLPLVDLHAQKALRRRIVLDKLKRILQDLQQSLGLRGFNLSEDVRSLVATFSLSAHNVTMRPAEWNLIAIVVIKLLSLKDKALEQSLNCQSSTKHLTLLLMSYSLDRGYLDRLISWLTDIDSLIQKQA